MARSCTWCTAALPAQQGRQGALLPPAASIWPSGIRSTWAPSSTTRPTRRMSTRCARWCADLHAVRLHPRRAKVASLPACCAASADAAYYRDAGLRPGSRDRGRASIDAAVVFSSSMAQYADGFAGPVLVDFVDVDSAKWTEYAPNHPWPMSWLYRREGRAACWPTSAPWPPGHAELLRHRQGGGAVPPPGARSAGRVRAHGQRRRRRLSSRPTRHAPVALRTRRGAAWCSPAPWTTGPTSTR
jgi:hypothetical protein